MAIINNNVQNIKFLRNQNLYSTRDEALVALEQNKVDAADGTALLARYQEQGDTSATTIVGFVYANGNTHDITIIDVNSASEDVEALRQEILDILGNGVSSSSTVTAQLSALSGNSSTDTSATTSVEGAKKYADDLISTLDGGITAETGSYIVSVSEVDGKVSGTTAALPSVSDTAAAKKFVTEVDQTNGEISVSRGEITSSAETMVLTDNADGGVNFEVNIDGVSIVQDTTSKKLKVADAALTQYVGDDDTVQISEAVDGVKTVSSPLTIQKVTTGLSEEVKEEYRLVGASGTTIGDPVKIYKDSSLVSIEYQDDPEIAHYQSLIYTYIDASGNTQTAYVDMSELVLEAEFASGVTVTNHIVHGVVDPTSEKDSQDTPVDFLTVGADGFKISGIKDEIDRQLDAIVEDLDATVSNSGNSGHVGVEIVEENGVITTVTVEEDNIANADDLEELSGKTVTEIASSNSSISATSSTTTDGTVKYDIVTDADKIKMSGFTGTSVLSGIAESDSISDAFEELEDVIEENERVTAEALTDLDTRVDTISGDVETVNDDVETISGDVETISGDVNTIKTNYVSGVSVNSNAVTVANNVAPISITAATSATTASTANAIVVDTDTTTGEITLGLNYIDAGYYDAQ